MQSGMANQFIWMSRPELCAGCGVLRKCLPNMM